MLSKPTQNIAPSHADEITAALPVRWLTLNFTLAERENAFRREQFDQTLSSTRWALVGVITLHFFALYLDTVILDADATIMRAVRLGALVPICAFTLALSFHSVFQQLSQPIIGLGVLVHSVMFPLGIVAFGHQSAMYFVIGTIMTLLFAYVALGLRFDIAAPICVASMTVTVASILVAHLPPRTMDIAIEGTVISTMILTLGAYRMERGSRREHFISEQLLAQERREREWLTLIAGFVRHELKNSVAGIGSSLQLIATSRLDDRGTEYVSRAARSLQFMRRFLDQVAAATNLESALKLQESQVLSLSELVTACVDDARQRDSGRVVQMSVESNVNVLGNADSCVQMIDKLLNNAIEHSTANTTIQVSLVAVINRAELTISNRGDSLPSDTERLFKPFVTTKHNVDGENLGLGLFVAQTIASHHGGTIVAEHLENPTGARFIVTLPVHIKQVTGFS